MSKTYRSASRPALRDVDLAIAPGETLALIGGSGSGKTTLLRLLNRMVEPSTGVVLRDGQAIGEIEPIELRRRTGYVQQVGGLLPHWTVERNVWLVPELLGWPLADRRRRARELLEAVGLDPDAYGDRHPHRLSGGERQRVAFARALAAGPRTLLLDEPFGALDAITRDALRRLFLELRRRFEATTVLVTHDIEEAMRLGDRVAVLHEGELLQVARPDELRATPAHPYVALLLEHGNPRAAEARP
ncbi:MAG TPA: ATP-binding cassette domain-containing protein [Thermoanaerobaculia bacterium]|nr:ATP-binding cassette domain-containing protein [Thermoanaerobaculia bacterium]